MSTSAFETALPFILCWEGGFGDHPKDPGGRTNKGVTQKVYDEWRKSLSQTAQDVKSIDDSEVAAIFSAS